MSNGLGLIMNEDVERLVDRTVTALERASERIRTSGNATDAEFSQLNSELEVLRQSAETSTRTISELSLRNGQLASEVEILKAKLLEKTDLERDESEVADIEKLLQNRKRDLDELDSVLTEMQKLLGKSDA